MHSIHIYYIHYSQIVLNGFKKVICCHLCEIVSIKVLQSLTRLSDLYVENVTSAGFVSQSHMVKVSSRRDTFTAKKINCGTES